MVDFIISPIARGIVAIFNLIFNVVGIYGFSLIILSIVVSLLLLPFYTFAEKIVEWQPFYGHLL